MTKSEIKSLKGNKENLPDGWQWVKLGEVCEFVGGMQPPKYVFQYEPLPDYVRLVQIQDFRKSDVAVYIPAKEAKRTFDESDVMIGRYGPPLFQILRGLSGAYNVALIKTVPKTNLLKDYLYYLLQEPSIQNAVIAQSQRSAGQTGVQKEFLERLEVSLPSVDEQKRIADILNEKMEAVERSRQATLAQLEAAKVLPSAYLRAVFNSPEAQKWERKLLAEISDLLPAKSIATDGDTEVLSITTACLTETVFDSSGVKKAHMWAKDAAECVVSQGEILIARSNTPDLVGRVAMFTGEPKGAVATDLTIRILPKPEFEPYFLTAYLSFLYLTGYWKERSGGSSWSMKKITRNQLLQEQVPAPFIKTQQTIIKILTEQMAEVEKLRKALEEQLEAINKLPSTFLRQAFNGEL